MDTYLQNVGKSREELRDEVRPTAQERLTRSLVVRKLAQEEGIEETSPEEIDAEVEKLTSGAGESSEFLRRTFSSESARSSIGSAMLTRKVLERLAQIVSGDVEVVETPEVQSASQEEALGSTQDAQAAVEEKGFEESVPHSPEYSDADQFEEEGDNASDNQPL
jgi:FKBP-type peptidyl-prolyl cis-trans isomerase (trigger factor)